MNEIDVAWYESKGNLNWAEVLKTIRDDVEGFVGDGGFEIFLEDGPNAEQPGEESESDEDDEEYKEVRETDRWTTAMIVPVVWSCRIPSTTQLPYLFQ